MPLSSTGKEARRLETLIISTENSLINLLFKGCSTLKLIKKVGLISNSLKEFYNNSANIYKSLSKGITKKSPLLNFAKRTWAFALTNLLMQKKLNKEYIDDQHIEQASKLMGTMSHDIYQYIPISRQEITDSFLGQFPGQELLGSKLADICVQSLLASHILNQGELEDCISCDKVPDIGKITMRIIDEASEKSRCLVMRLLETNNELYSAVANEFHRIKGIVMKEYSKVSNGGVYLAQLEKDLKVYAGLPRYCLLYTSPSPRDS